MLGLSTCNMSRKGLKLRRLTRMWTAEKMLANWRTPPCRKAVQRPMSAIDGRVYFAMSSPDRSILTACMQSFVIYWTFKLREDLKPQGMENFYTPGPLLRWAWWMWSPMAAVQELSTIGISGTWWGSRGQEDCCRGDVRCVTSVRDRNKSWSFW